MQLTRRIGFATVALGLVGLVWRSRQRALAAGEMPVVGTVTINRSPDIVYGFYRAFENLPTFMRHLEGVEVIDETRSRWHAKVPLGGTVSWDAAITEDRPAEVIAWTGSGLGVWHKGRVTFLPTPGRGGGTEVRVEMSANGLMRRIGGSEIKGDLRRLKQVLETGVVLR
jgi:uncharacterized membrane protein